MREIKRRLPAAEWHYHEWFQFNDDNGRGHCEPELFAILKDRIVLFEMKLMGGIAGRMQLMGLYKPVLEFVFRRPVVCCLMCKNISPSTPGPFFNSAEDFIRSGKEFGTWHWLPTA